MAQARAFFQKAEAEAVLQLSSAPTQIRESDCDGSGSVGVGMPVAEQQNAAARRREQRVQALQERKMAREERARVVAELKELIALYRVPLDALA